MNNLFFLVIFVVLFTLNSVNAETFDELVEKHRKESEEAYNKAVNADKPKVIEDCKILNPLIKKWNAEGVLDEGDCCNALFYKAICEGERIIELDLSNTFISATIKDSDVEVFKQLKSLEKLYLNGNKFKGEIPKGFTELNLDTLDLSDNDFSGEMPHFGSSIKNVCVADNNLEGDLPDDYPGCENSDQEGKTDYFTLFVIIFISIVGTIVIIYSLICLIIPCILVYCCGRAGCFYIKSKKAKKEKNLERVPYEEA